MNFLGRFRARYQAARYFDNLGIVRSFREGITWAWKWR